MKKDSTVLYQVTNYLGHPFVTISLQCEVGAGIDLRFLVYHRVIFMLISLYIPIIFMAIFMVLESF